MLCRGRTVSLFTLNGDPILNQGVCHEPDDMITACAFYEGAGNEYLERDLFFTGHKRGVVNVCHSRRTHPTTCILMIETGLEPRYQRWKIRA